MHKLALPFTNLPSPVEAAVNNCALPVFHRVFSYLAAKYALYMDQMAAVDPQTYLHTALTVGQESADLPRSTVWFAFQEQLCHIAERQHLGLRRLDRATRAMCRIDAWSLAELTLLGEMVMYYRDNCPSWRMPWATVEALSATQLDDSVRCGHITESLLPATLWMEWPEAPSPSHYKPWITSVRGLLVSRYAAFEVPVAQRENLALQAKNNRRVGREDQMQVAYDLATLPDPMGYTVLAVKQRRDRLEFCPIFLGHERKASLHDLLHLHKISSDKDRHKTKDLEQTWANVAIRLLLYAAHTNLFSTSKQIELAQVPPDRIGPAAHFLFERGSIVMRKLAQRTFPRFRLES